MNRIPKLLSFSAVAASALLQLFFSLSSASAQSLRSSFPGRRIGGGTRGECTSRLVAHLVPEDNVYAPPESQQSVVGLILGSSPAPAPLSVSFRPFKTSGSGSSAESTLTFAPSQASVVLISLPSAIRPLVWESSFDCSQEDSAGEFGFVVSSSPPAISLLSADASPADQLNTSLLSKLRSRCGQTVDAEELLSEFKLTDLSSHGLPVSLPIICPAAQK